MRPNSSVITNRSFFAPDSLLIALVLGIMLILMTLSGWHKNLSFDEPHNLRYGHDVLTKGPLAETDGQRMPVFVLNALACKSYQCDYDGYSNNPVRRFWIRLPVMIFTLILGWLIWYWCRDLYGPKAALGAIFLYAFNPNVIAHGKQITSDMLTSLLVVLTVFFFWKWRNSQKDKFFYFTSLAAGAAMVAKFSSILLLGILPLILIVDLIWQRKFRFDFAAIVKRTAVFGLIVWTVINTAYLFAGTFENSKSYAWQSSLYQKTLGKTSLPVPFPRIFAKGLDYSQLITEHPEYGRGNNYILGKRHRKGRDYAPPLMIALKTPIGFFILLLVSLAIWQRRKNNSPSGIYLWIPFAAWLVFFSSLCDIQVGIRYLLPGYVFLLIFASKAFEYAGTLKRSALVGAASLWYLVSALLTHPHYMPYFNEVIGARINAYKYLADSNLDWEDQTYYIKKWEAEHPGIVYQTHPEAMQNPKPGFFLMPANYYVGVFNEDEYRWIRQFKPLAQVAYSHYLLYISPEEFERAMKERI